MSVGAKIFNTINKKSDIDPYEEENKKMITRQDFNGVIEFKDVWFRYPTRNTDWIF